MAKSFALGIYILRRSAMFIPIIPGVVFKNDNIGIKLIISASLSLIILFIR